MKRALAIVCWPSLPAESLLEGVLKGGPEINAPSGKVSCQDRENDDEHEGTKIAADHIGTGINDRSDGESNT